VVVVGYWCMLILLDLKVAEEMTLLKGLKFTKEMFLKLVAELDFDCVIIGINDILRHRPI